MAKLAQLVRARSAIGQRRASELPGQGGGGGGGRCSQIGWAPRESFKFRARALARRRGSGASAAQPLARLKSAERPPALLPAGRPLAGALVGALEREESRHRRAACTRSEERRRRRRRRAFVLRPRSGGLPRAARWRPARGGGAGPRARELGAAHRGFIEEKVARSAHETGAQFGHWRRALLLLLLAGRPAGRRADQRGRALVCSLACRRKSRGSRKKSSDDGRAAKRESRLSLLPAAGMSLQERRGAERGAHKWAARVLAARKTSPHSGPTSAGCWPAGWRPGAQVIGDQTARGRNKEK